MDRRQKIRAQSRSASELDQYYITELNAQVVIGNENYFLSADGLGATKRSGTAGFEIFQANAEVTTSPGRWAK
jgi:hypothetical protein